MLVIGNTNDDSEWVENIRHRKVAERAAGQYCSNEGRKTKDERQRCQGSSLVFRLSSTQADVLIDMCVAGRS
ncbi:MAG: hypothetical protein ABI901_01115, partial [Roseiflexaceae bacterium]